MSGNFHWIVPSPPPASDILATYQLTWEFYREATYREELEQYCQWYRTVAAQHQHELQKMQRDINLLGWFYRGL
jgi:hypothetical protein